MAFLVLICMEKSSYELIKLGMISWFKSIANYRGLCRSFPYIYIYADIPIAEAVDKLNST